MAPAATGSRIAPPVCPPKIRLQRYRDRVPGPVEHGTFRKLAASRPRSIHPRQTPPGHALNTSRFARWLRGCPRGGAGRSHNAGILIRATCREGQFLARDPSVPGRKPRLLSRLVTARACAGAWQGREDCVQVPRSTRRSTSLRESASPLATEPKTRTLPAPQSATSRMISSRPMWRSSSSVMIPLLSSPTSFA